ncbi:hypothetical protein V3471_14825 [Flavobacterium oreochromis]|uniref:hypothetical protein n=1 Tax=Flavobacterium oreochromis TaxID=2906078 RepID=UPI00385DAA13
MYKINVSRETKIKIMTNRKLLMDYFENDLCSEKEEVGNVIFYHYLNDFNQYGLALLKPKKQKLEYNLCFNNLETYDSFYDKQKEKYILEKKEEDRRNEVYALKRKFVKKGDIFVNSWGYDQTNVQFYLVVDRVKDFLKVQEIGVIKNYKGFDYGDCIPDLDNLKGDSFRKKLGKFCTIRINEFSTAFKWDGNPMYWSNSN